MLAWVVLLDMIERRSLPFVGQRRPGSHQPDANTPHAVEHGRQGQILDFLNPGLRSWPQGGPAVGPAPSAQSPSQRQSRVAANIERSNLAAVFGLRTGKQPSFSHAIKTSSADLDRPASNKSHRVEFEGSVLHQSVAFQSVTPSFLSPFEKDARQGHCARLRTLEI